MEFKSTNKRNQPSSSEASHYTESNAGHISVKTTSPFLNKVKDSEYSVSEQNPNRSKKNHSAIVLNKKIPRDIGSGTSKMLINQILGDNNVEKDLISNVNKPHSGKSIKTKKCNYDQNILNNNVQFKYSTPTFNSKSFSMQHGWCSREESIIESNISMSENKVCYRINNSTYSEKRYDEKTTYCRPSKNKDLEYITKIIEKNNRLQRIVQELIDARKKEKQTETWNNYINELKNKHGYGDSGRKKIIGRNRNEELTRLHCIDDYYSKSRPSNPCKDLLNEFYEAQYNTVQYEGPYKYINYKNQKLPTRNYRSHFNHSNCYPMSSQGRLTMLNRGKNKNPYDNDLCQLPSGRLFQGNIILVEKDPTQRSSSSRTQSKRIQDGKCTCNDLSTSPNHTSTAVQTEAILVGVPNAVENDNRKDKQINSECTQEENIKDIYSRVSENVDRLKKKIQETCGVDTSYLQHTVLQSIESKLDTLLTSINSFIDEVKSRAHSSDPANPSHSYDCRTVSMKPLYSKKDMSVSRSDTFDLIKAEKMVCGLVEKPQNIDRILLGTSCSADIDKILMEEMNNSNRVKEDIESMLSANVGSCSVQISIEIPTKDISTEVTDSLSKTVFRLEDKAVSIEEIINSSPMRNECMTIAVNTDPLGLLALLRVSTEAVKQLLSYMPNIPYHHYLSLINFPQSRQATDYVCNICGAAFTRPSQLSDHIQSHNLGRTRDCCVCRHVLDMQRHRPPGLFRCQHCGQRFTRAYCCELHQESCARLHGLRHDVSPSLMLLS